MDTRTLPRNNAAIQMVADIEGILLDDFGFTAEKDGRFLYDFEQKLYEYLYEKVK